MRPDRVWVRDMMVLRMTPTPPRRSSGKVVVQVPQVWPGATWGGSRRSCSRTSFRRQSQVPIPVERVPGQVQMQVDDQWFAHGARIAGSRPGKQGTVRQVRQCLDGLGRPKVLKRGHFKSWKTACSVNLGSGTLRLERGGLPDAAHIRAQFSIRSPGTRPNSPGLLVTRVAPTLRAWAAMRRSLAPMG